MSTSRRTAIIGYSGFVGSTLIRQTRFDDQYRSLNIDDISGKVYDLVVCTAAPAQKWVANQNPDRDAAVIDQIIGHLGSFDTRKLILISTVDVFSTPLQVTEDTVPDTTVTNAYGWNRLRLERFVSSHFSESLIVRLPGLVGPGLKKNILFDLLNQNAVEKIDCRSEFQFYPMVNLWSDIEESVRQGMSLIHLTSEPISTAEVASAGFGIQIENTTASKPVKYDFRSKYGRSFGGNDGYQYSKRESLLAIRAYAQSEPLRVRSS